MGNLFVCNTVYQVLVAMWMKYTNLAKGPADIIISDHMNNGKEICERMKSFSQFENCYYVESFKYARQKLQLNYLEQKIRYIAPKLFLNKFLFLEKKYEDVYVANLDGFTQLLFDGLYRTNKNIQFFIFEDGLATYSKQFEKYYKHLSEAEYNKLHQWIHRYVYRKADFEKHIKMLYLFNPQNVRWQVPLELMSIPKINSDDLKFRDMCNVVFEYDESDKAYTQKYIFMEESFFAEGVQINDVELLNKLAERVGKDNIIVKIHPRNQVNRFAIEGYKTNTNTSIPWEVVLMNLDDVSNKIFITISSSSVLNSILIFGKRVQVYSLYNLVNQETKESEILTGDLWQNVKSLFEKYDDMVTICSSLDEVK